MNSHDIRSISIIPNQSEIKIIFVGDVFFPFDRKFGGLCSEDYIKDLVGNCDLFIYNFEGTLYNKHLRNDRRSILVMNKDIINVLKVGKKNIAVLANNHISDAGPDGIINTQNYLHN